MRSETRITFPRSQIWRWSHAMRSDMTVANDSCLSGQRTKRSFGMDQVRIILIWT